MPSNRNAKLRLNRNDRRARLNIFKCLFPGCCNFISYGGVTSRFKCKTHGNEKNLKPDKRGLHGKIQPREKNGRFVSKPF